MSWIHVFDFNDSFESYTFSLDLVQIVRRNHIINDNTGNSDIKPNWKGEARIFFVFFEIPFKCKKICEQNKWNNGNTQYNVCRENKIVHILDGSNVSINKPIVI